MPCMVDMKSKVSARGQKTLAIVKAEWESIKERLEPAGKVAKKSVKPVGKAMARAGRKVYGKISYAYHVFDDQWKYDCERYDEWYERRQLAKLQRMGKVPIAFSNSGPRNKGQPDINANLGYETYTPASPATKTSNMLRDLETFLGKPEAPMTPLNKVSTQIMVPDPATEKQNLSGPPDMPRLHGKEIGGSRCSIRPSYEISGPECTAVVEKAKSKVAEMDDEKI